MTEKNTSKGAIAWMAGNSVAANLLMIVFLAGGIIMGTQIKQEVFPEFDMDFVVVSVPYPGASPEEVEQGIILVIEEAVQGLEGISEVQSSAKEGSGTVTIEALVGADIQKLANDIQSEVDRISSFPDEAEEPQVEIASHRREVLNLAIYGDNDEKILREIAENLRNDLLQKPNITQVDLSAARDYEISIEVSQEKLRAYNLTLSDVAKKIKNTAVELPGGGIKTSSGEILVRMKERRDFGREFAQIPIISSSDGTEVRLDELANIIDGFEDVGKHAAYNGKRAVLLDVFRVGDQTPIEISDTVKNYIQKIKGTFPPGIEVAILRDRSEIYSQRMNLLLKNGYLGLGLVFILLGLFLEPRLAFWVAMGIPISFLGGLLILPICNISINMISMFAFIIALGIVVDDAIVVGENIHSHRQKGHPFFKASILGAKEVAMPVTFSILTNIVAFMPMYFVPGRIGKVFKAIPVVVIIVFIISLIESIFVLPAHLAHQKEKSNQGIMGRIFGWQQAFSRKFIKIINEIYQPFLEKSLKNRYLVMAIGFAVLIIVLAYVQSGRMGMTLFPRIESDYAKVTAELPYGSPIEQTEALHKILVQSAMEVAEKHGGKKLLKGIFGEVGTRSGEHITEVRAYLTPPEVRTLNTAEFTRLWRKKAGSIAGLESLQFRSDSGGPGSGAALTVELSHKDINILAKAGEDLAANLENFPNVHDIEDGFSQGKEQIDFKIKPEGQSLGLTAQFVAEQLRHSFYGAEALRQQRGRNEIKVMVRFPKNERISEYNLEEMILLTPSGIEVPLRQVVDATRNRAYTSITRRNGRNVISVTADVEPQEQANQILKDVKAVNLPNLIKKYSGLGYSFEGKQADIKESMTSLFTGLMFAMMIIYAMLAIPFKSYVQPAIVMTSIPFGIVGAVIGHLLMGYSLSVMSMFGVVALSGVVVNDSLILIDFANRKRRDGSNALEAVLSAGVQRFRPILLTTLTTFGGLAPMIFETSRQARFLIPMALSLGFGVLFATLITLILVPSLYMILEDLKKIAGNFFEFLTSP
ncbi:Acriflavin resistance protein [Candidatus Magnetomoraceae bacterium gMMP-15]